MVDAGKIEGIGSFQAILRLVKIADEKDCPAAGEILGRHVIANPGDCPHCLYDAQGFYSTPSRNCGHG